jgi:preprotein translocase subunit SecD
MRNRSDWHRFRRVALLLSALLAAFSSAACAGDLQAWEAHRPAGAPRSSLAFRLVLDEPGPGTLKLTGPGGTPLILSSDTVVTQADITKAEVVEIPQWREDQPTHYVINLYFKPDAAHRLGQFTRDHVGRSLAIVVDGNILMVPNIMSAIESPAMIDGRYSTRADAMRVAEQLAP